MGGGFFLLLFCVHLCVRAFVCVSAWQKSIETCNGSRVVRVMWSRCLSHLSLFLFLGLFQQEGFMSCCPYLHLCMLSVNKSYGLPLIIYGQELMHLCAFLLHVTNFSLYSMCACAHAHVCVCVCGLQLQCQCTWPCWVACGKPPKHKLCNLTQQFYVRLYGPNLWLLSVLSAEVNHHHYWHTFIDSSQDHFYGFDLVSFLKIKCLMLGPLDLCVTRF